MSFSFSRPPTRPPTRPSTRPPSPVRRDTAASMPYPHPPASMEEDSLYRALHAALAPHALAQGDHHHATHHHHGDGIIGKEKDKPHLDIVLNSDTMVLKGTGNDVEPALLSGHVSLYLTESMSLKEITLQFRGKARLPATSAEPLSLNSNPNTLVVCNHEWSFLEGEKRHSHTLKAGTHLFPFQLQIGGSLPSSTSTGAFGGASVHYKLRATAVRGSFAHKLHAQAPVSIVRSFASEALEYQQTLEIENTWPEKLMYSIMIPHKAWAIGDKLTALVKFSPLVKGARVLSVTTTINETTRVVVRGQPQEHTRTVGTTKHEIQDGKAVQVEETFSRYRQALLGHHTLHSHGLNTTAQSTAQSAAHSISHTPGHMTPHHGEPGLSPLHTASPTLPAAEPSSSSSSSSSSSIPEAGPSRLPDNHSTSTSTGTSTNNDGPHLPDHPPTDVEMGQADVVTYITVPIPLAAVPSHVLEPIIVSHRIRWSILIANLDGHTSELRCSLPIHVLDRRLLFEARGATAATRRLLIGGPETPVADDEDEMELPSYPAHVRDRLADMYLPEAVSGGMRAMGAFSPLSNPLSGANSPSEHHPHSQAQQYFLPHHPSSGTNTPLDYVNSQLMRTLSRDSSPPQPPHAPLSPPPPLFSFPAMTNASRRHTPPESHPPSVRPSRRQSRASSPERSTHGPHLDMSTLVPRQTDTRHETFLHSQSNASRTVPGIFSASMVKPSGHHHSYGWLGGGGGSNNASANGANGANSTAALPRSGSHTSIASTAGAPTNGLLSMTAAREPASHGSGGGDGASSSGTTTPANGFSLSQVPDYGQASRTGGANVPPLTSLVGLPSYEEAEGGGSNNHGSSGSGSSSGINVNSNSNSNSNSGNNNNNGVSSLSRESRARSENDLASFFGRFRFGHSHAHAPAGSDPTTPAS